MIRNWIAFPGMVMLLATSLVGGDSALADTIVVKSVTIRVLVEAEVPARETGVLASLNVRPGDRVSAGQVIGTLNDKEARIVLSEAKTQQEIARKEVNSDLGVKAAESILGQEVSALTRYEVSHRIAIEKANSDVLTRLAQKNRDMAFSDLRRAQKSKAAFSPSVSQAELDRLQTAFDRQVLEIEKEQQAQTVAKMSQEAEKAALEQQEKVKDRAQLELDLAKHDNSIARMALTLREQSVQLAEIKLERRAITSPIDGFVVEQFRNEGEWVEPGMKVVRVLGLDRLQAEGFVDSREINADIRGARVELEVTKNGKRHKFNGTVSFVGLEADAINKQVRISVDVPNPKGLLQPGMTASMVIHTDEIAEKRD
jgi:multidrug efflux pump subunit AcrA (membrane-fusion protein)